MFNEKIKLACKISNFVLQFKDLTKSKWLIESWKTNYSEALWASC